MSHLGLHLSQLRQRAGMSRRDLYKKMGMMDNGMVSQWEKGTYMPSYSNIIGLCYALNVTPNQFFQWDRDDEDKLIELYASLSDGARPRSCTYDEVLEKAKGLSEKNKKNNHIIKILLNLLKVLERKAGYLY